MLEESQAINAFVALDNILRAQGLGWICEQVQDDIRLGKLTEKEVETYKEVAAEDANDAELISGPRRIGKGRKATLMTVEDFSAHERLRMLIDAMERAVVDVGDMEEQISIFFANPQGTLQTEEGEDGNRTEMESAKEVRFVRLVEERRDVATTPKRPDERGDAIRQLRALIAELRAEI